MSVTLLIGKLLVDKRWLMGIDIGGGSVRCMLVDASSGVAITASCQWHFARAPGTSGTGYDLDLDEIWKIIAQASRDALQQAQIQGSMVAAVAVSAMRFSTVLLDAAGNSLLAVPNKDARAVGECFGLAEQQGQAILKETGCWPLPIHTSARLLWLQQHQPASFEQVHSVFGLGDWFNQRLCGVRATEASQASSTGLFALARRQWCWELIDQLGLPREIFPPLIDAGSRIGEVADEAAAAMGLDAGTPVGMGGGDTQSSLLGSGAISPGDSVVVAGTTAPVQVVLDQPLVDTDGCMLGGHHLVPNLWVLESNSGTMGESLSWMARLLFPDAPEPERRLLAEAGLAGTGAAGMLSTLGGEIMNAKFPTLPVGHIILSHMTGDGDSSARPNLARALLEGFSCALRANLEQLGAVLARDLPAVAIDQLILCGGLSRSEVFSQQLADTAAREVAVPVFYQTTALGAAICAGVAAGCYADFTEACKVLTRVGRRFMAQPERAEVNQRLYDNWSRFREAAAGATAPIAAEHMLPWVLREADEDAAGSTSAVIKSGGSEN